MALIKYRKKYEMNKKQAEAALQDILAASGQDDIVGRSRRAFHRNSNHRLWIPVAAALAILLTLAGIMLWQQ